MAEKMKPSEDFIEYALRWRAMAARSDVRLTEAQEIQILINNATGPIRRELAISDCHSIDHLYTKAVNLQRIHKETESRTKYSKRTTQPTTEGVTVSEQVNVVSQANQPIPTCRMPLPCPVG